MKRLVVILVALAALVVPVAASAHPLGNFTINRFSRVEVSGHRLYVVYVLDLAEIPTFQAGRIDAQSYARRISRGAQLTVDGRHAALTPVATALAHPAGAAGLRTTRLEVLLRGPVVDGSTSARLPRHELRRPHRLEGDRRRPERARARATSCARIRRACSPRRSTSRRCTRRSRRRARRRRRSRAAVRCRHPTASPTPASRSSSVASTSASGSCSRRSRPRSSGARRTRSRRATGSRSSRRTSSAAAARRGTRRCSG